MTERVLIEQLHHWASYYNGDANTVETILHNSVGNVRGRCATTALLLMDAEFFEKARAYRQGFTMGLYCMGLRFLVDWLDSYNLSEENKEVFDLLLKKRNGMTKRQKTCRYQYQNWQVDISTLSQIFAQCSGK